MCTGPGTDAVLEKCLTPRCFSVNGMGWDEKKDRSEHVPERKENSPRTDLRDTELEEFYMSVKDDTLEKPMPFPSGVRSWSLTPLHGGTP